MIPTKILVVDDDSVVARDLSRCLERLGYQVPAVVGRIDDALRVARESRAELALLEARLDMGRDGRADGWGPGARIRQELRIPIVYVTSEDDPTVLRRVMTADRSGLLLKPFREDELRSVIELAIERHRLESRLAAAERRFSTALRSVGEAVVVTDPSGRISFMNPAAERLVCVRHDEACGRSFIDVVRLVERGTGVRLPDPCARSLRSRMPVGLEDSLALALSGRRLAVSGKVTPMIGERGEPLGAVVSLREAEPGPGALAVPVAGGGAGTFSLRRAADLEEKAEREEEAEREESNEERYFRIFRTNPAAITLTALSDGRVIEVNDAFSHLSGWQPEEAVGTTLVELGWWVSPRDHAWLAEAVRGDALVEDVEMTFCTRSGQLRETIVSAERIHVDDEDCVLSVIHDITERKELERELERHALHDPLTGLPNRTLFRDRLDHALDRVQRRGTKVAVLFLDLDGFKEVNDGLGHTRGDELLRAVAERVRGCVREGDTFARFGGDEFAAVLEPIEGFREARRVAMRFVESLEAPIEVGGIRIPMCASIGIAIGGPGDVCPEELVRAADIAMYRAKEDPGTSFKLFDPSSDAHRHGGRRVRPH